MNWLVKAAREHLDSSPWNLPKGALPGDQVVIYVLGYGFFATASVLSTPAPRKGWYRRYAAPLTTISLVQPPISLGVIRSSIPSLTWARYPRSITTPPPRLDDRIRRLISDRQRSGVRSLSAASLSTAGIDELRAVGLLAARPHLSPRQRQTLYRLRSKAIRLYVLCRADGRCEACKSPAPFSSSAGRPYLEPHHTTRVADQGPDHPAHVIGLCPNCHRRAHMSIDAPVFNKQIQRRLRSIERIRRSSD